MVKSQEIYCGFEYAQNTPEKSPDHEFTTPRGYRSCTKPLIVPNRAVVPGPKTGFMSESPAYFEHRYGVTLASLLEVAGSGSWGRNHTPLKTTVYILIISTTTFEDKFMAKISGFSVAWRVSCCFWCEWCSREWWPLEWRPGGQPPAKKIYDEEDNQKSMCLKS